MYDSFHAMNGGMTNRLEKKEIQNERNYQWK